MKLRVILKILIPILLLSSSANALFTDLSLPTVKGVKRVVDRSSIGFEWKSLANFPRVQGVNIYRAKAINGSKQMFDKIATVPTRYATHYVDTTAQPGVRYYYTFTTIAGISESAHGDIVAVKSKPPYKSVKFVSATLVDRGIVKLLWVPHSEPTIMGYIIQRECSDNNRWDVLSRVRGRLFPEYIDTKAPRGYICNYRVFAVDGNGMTSKISKELQVKVR